MDEHLKQLIELSIFATVGVAVIWFAYSLVQHLTYAV